MVRINGRPIKNRKGTSDVSAAAVKAINQASGRFSHGNADQLTNVNSATTENKTSPSVLHLLHRKICRSRKCQPKLVSILKAEPSTRISGHGLPLTALAA